MATFLIGYTIIALIVMFVIFVILVSRRIIFRNNAKIQSIFAHPLLIYSLKRIGSAFISIMLAISATYLLLRLKSRNSICQSYVENWDKLPYDIREIRCDNVMRNLGLYANNFWEVIGQIFNYFYKILPFPKTLCREDAGTEPIYDAFNNLISYVKVHDCRTFIIDLGISYKMASGSSSNYVIDIIFGERMMHSFRIGIIAVVIELAIGYPLGVLMAKHKDGIVDKIGKTYIISIDAIPGVAYYYIWQLLLVYLIGLPNKYESANFVSWLAPALTMGLTGMAGIALWVRRFMLDEFNSDYVKFARSKGISENRIMYTHVLRNAIVPLIRSIPASILGALLGSFYIENIYGVPGLGEYLIRANESNDLYALQGIVVVSAFISIIAYLAGDIVTAMVDPRVSLASE
ncbi:MAG: ABC transporter permease [Erysipelotrichales bacterium]|nr:ABC transporter permease [Erysipelotrichales bacterium]